MRSEGYSASTAHQIQEQEVIAPEGGEGEERRRGIGQKNKFSA